MADELHLPSRGAGHAHDPKRLFWQLGESPADEREQAAQQLVAMLDAETDNNHVAGAVNIERAELLLDLLLVECECGRTVASQLGVEPLVEAATGPDRRRKSLRLRSSSQSGPAQAAAPVVPGLKLTGKGRDNPNTGTYLHNLWHLLRG